MERSKVKVVVIDVGKEEREEDWGDRESSEGHRTILSVLAFRRFMSSSLLPHSAVQGRLFLTVIMTARSTYGPPCPLSRSSSPDRCPLGRSIERLYITQPADPLPCREPDRTSTRLHRGRSLRLRRRPSSRRISGLISVATSLGHSRCKSHRAR